MKIKKRVLPAVLFSLFAAGAASSAQAQSFSSTVVFGDSLSDAGFFRPFLASLGLPASTVATLGRFTTSPGPVWSELVTQYYGGTPAPSNAGGNIFAQGGARVASDSASNPPGTAQRSVVTQVTEYLTRSNGQADPNALFTMWAGANDVIQTLQGVGAGQIPIANVSTIITNTANAEIAQVARLQAAGARYVMVFGLPNIGATPAFQSLGPANAAAATQASQGYNTALFAGLASAGLHVIPIDAYSFLADTLANPTKYGFTNTTIPACKPFPPFSTAPDAFFCPPGNTLTPNANQTFLFADGIHPTTAGHAEIAQFVEGIITGPAQYSLLAESPLHTRDAHVRTVWEGMASTAGSSVGTMSVWATYDHGTFDVDNTSSVVGLNSKNNAGTLGMSARISENVTIGAGIGHTTSDAGFGGAGGGYRTNETTFSAFAAGQWGGFYGNAIVSIANIDYSNVSRNINIGPAVLVAQANNPTGSNGSAYVTAGYDFRIDRFRVGPLVAVTSQDVTVNGFDESGADSSNLRIMQQTRKSEVYSVGVHASMDMPWSPWIRVTADKERKDDQRFVTAVPLTLVATNNTYSIPAYAFDDSYATISLGVRGTIMERVGASLAYYKVTGRSGIKEDGITAMLAYKF